MASGPVRAVFSDIDGTLVHTAKALEAQGYSLVDPPGSGLPCSPCAWRHDATGTVLPCHVVPTLTQGSCFVTIRTLELVQQLRSCGVLFVLLTGARTSTFRIRRDSGSLPAADFDVCENGGKLWRNTWGSGAGASASPQLTSSVLDPIWSAKFVSVTGDWAENDAIPNPSERQGPLWDCFRAVRRDGCPEWKLDAKDCSTAFMIDIRNGELCGPDAEAFLIKRFCAEYSPKHHVAMEVNLGKCHVTPVGCNKRTAVQYICSLAGISQRGERTVALFDDANDLGFAELCTKGFVPSVAHPSVLDALKRHGDAFRRTEHDGLLGTEEALSTILEMATAGA